MVLLFKYHKYFIIEDFMLISEALNILQTNGYLIDDRITQLQNYCNLQSMQIK